MMPTLERLLHLAAIRERESKATPGPWQAYRPAEFPGDIRLSRRTAARAGEWNEGYVCRLTPAHVGVAGADAGVLPPRMEDAEFMAHARADVPWLLAHVAALEEALVASEAAHHERPACCGACGAMVCPGCAPDGCPCGDPDDEEDA
jgi:hypothetical protein